MEIFNKDGKINFVDENNVVVGYDMQSQCCEDFGYFFSRQRPDSILYDAENDSDFDFEGFVFDRNFYEEDALNNSDNDYGNVAIFRLTNGNNEIYLTLFNIHNGYYTHNFQVVTGGEIIHDGSL